jgi:hypothetical protein
MMSVVAVAVDVVVLQMRFLPLFAIVVIALNAIPTALSNLFPSHFCERCIETIIEFHPFHEFFVRTTAFPRRFGTRIMNGLSVS